MILPCVWVILWCWFQKYRSGRLSTTEMQCVPYFKKYCMTHPPPFTAGLYSELERCRGHGKRDQFLCINVSRLTYVTKVNNLETQFTTLYQQQAFQPFTVNGQSAGQFKNAGTFSYVRIYGAGHEVPAYKFGTLETGQAAFQFFSQIMANQSLSAT